MIIELLTSMSSLQEWNLISSFQSIQNPETQT